MNKLIAILTAFILFFNLPIISNANDLTVTNPDQSYENTYVIDMGDGLTIEYEICEVTSNARTSTKTATKTATCKEDGKVIATIKLTASFSYTGSSATCTSASSSYSMAAGWSYTNRTTTRSGNRATTSAKLLNNCDYANVSVTMTCSSTGVVS